MGLIFALRRRVRLAVTATIGAVLLLAIAAGGIGIFFGILEFSCPGQCGGIAQITLGQASLNSTSKTLYFSLDNSYAGNTTISSAVVDGDLPCNGTFPVIVAHSITSSSCTVTNSELHFVRGQKVTFVIYLENAQVVTDTISAE